MSQSHNFQQRRQERMRGTGTSSVTQSSQKFQFKLPPPSGGSHASSAVPRPTASSGSRASSGGQSLGPRPSRDAATRAPRDPYVFSGSTAPGVPGSGNAMSPPARSTGEASMRMPSASRPSGSRSNGMPSSGGSRSYSAQQPPRSAMKGARASTSARPSLPASNQSRTSLGKRRATQEEEDDAEADRFEDESVVDISVDPLLPDASFDDRSPMRADKSVSFKQLPANSSSRKSLKDTSNRKQTNITQFSTGKRSGPVPPSAASRSQDDEPRRKKSRQSSPPRPPPKDTEKARKRREAEKQRDKERAEAKRAAAAINERSKKRRRAVGDEDGDEDEDDGDPEYEVEFEDDDEDGGAGPDTTLQEEVIIGARMAKDTRRINGQTAKLMRKRLRRAIRLALAEDPDNVLDDADESGGAPARKRRSTGADKLTDADVIWSVLDAELKAASTSQASSIASSTLRELRKIIRTLFEGLSVKASERRELISQLERARSRKKRIRREVFEARRIVLENEEEINRIKEESVDSANRAKTAEDSLSFFQKLKAVREMWT